MSDVISHGISITVNSDGTATFIVEAPVGSTHTAFTLAAADWTAAKALTSGQNKSVQYGENSMPHLPREYFTR